MRVKPRELGVKDSKEAGEMARQAMVIRGTDITPNGMERH